MVESLIELLNTLNGMSPLAVIALLAVILYRQTQSHRQVTTLKNNDLHEMPDLVAEVRIISATLQRIEVKMGEDFAYLKARANGK